MHSALCGCRNVFAVPSARSLKDKIDVYSLCLVRAYRVLVFSFSTLMLSCFKLLAKQIFVLLSSFSLAPIKLPRHIYTKIPVLSKAEMLSLSSQQILNLKMTAAILPVSKENQCYLISLAILQCHLHNVKFRSSTVTCSHSFTTLMSIGSA